MNRIYKVVWSKARNCYVVTSELAKNYTKLPKSGIMSRALVTGVLACVLSCSFSASSFAAVEMSDEEYRSFHNSGQEVYLTNLQGGTYTGLAVVRLFDCTFRFSGDTANGKHYLLTENEYKSALGVSSIHFFESPYVSVNSSLSNIGTDGPSATGFNSIAIGSGATVTADNSVALGANSVAGLEDTVSVGSTTSQRRIVNVADGLGEHDAVTVGQLATALDNYAGINFTAGDGLHLNTNAVLDIKGGTNVTVDNNGVSVIGSGTVSNGNTGLISGNTLYNEVRIPNNGTYIKSNSTIADNLYRLDYAVSNAGVKYFGVNSPSKTSMNYEGGGAMGYDSIAIGDAKSAGSASIGIGAGTLVTGQNSIAIGTNAMASGDGLSREAVDSILSNNKNIREGLDTARSTFTASQNAYNLQLERFNKQNEAYARVQYANQLIAGYQDEINSTLQPNADTANEAYLTAKGNYDGLYNLLLERLNAIKYIDFMPYTQNDVVDTNAVAAELKTQTETDTSFNYPQQFYKAYVDAYIESEGNGRETFLKVQKLSPSSSYSNNNTVQTISFYTDDVRTSAYIADPFFKSIGWENPDVPDGAFDGINFGASFKVNVNTGELISQDITNYWIPFWHAVGMNGWKIAINGSSLPNYYAYAKTQTLDDASYDSCINTVDTTVNNRIQSLDDKFAAMISTGVLTDEEQAMALDAKAFCIDYENRRRDLVKNILSYSHEQYLYEKYKNEEGENSSNALLHLSRQGEYKQAVTDVLGESQAEKLFTPGDSTEMYFMGGKLFSSTSYIELTGAGNIHGAGFGFVPSVNNRLVQWYKSNVLDSQNLVKYSLNQLKGSMTDFLSDTQTAYDEATAAKTAADNALNAKRQQIAQATPSQADIDAANAAQASATELQQKADKLEADRTALETAKAALDELQSIEEAGKGAIAIGDTAITTGEDAIGMGTNVIVTGENAVAVGKGSIISGDRAVALGTNNSISKEQSIAIGTNNGITGENSIAIGNNNVISGNNSIAIGNSLNVTDDNVVSIGNRRMTNIAAGTADTDAVNLKQLNDAIQDFEIDTDGVVEQGNTGLISGGTVFNESRISSDGRYVRSANTVAQNFNAIDAIMVGYDSAVHDTLTFDGTNGTKLTNLKPAILSASSTDAVIGAQLHETNQNITGFSADIIRNKNNIRDLNTSVSAALSSVSSTSNLVETLNNTKADASLNNLSVTGRQVIATAAANAVQEYMATYQNTALSNPVAPTAYNPNALTVTNAGNGSLYVGEGSNVNGTSSIAIGVGNQVNANNAGAFGDPSIINADESYVLGNDDTVNIGAVASFIVGNDSVSSAKGGLLFGSNSEATDTAENSMGLGNNTTVSAKNAVALGNGSIADEEDTVSVGNSTLQRRITNVANGNIEENSTDAVTGSQLYTTNQTVLQHSDLIAKNASNILDNAKEIANNKLEIATKADLDAGNINAESWTQKLGIGKVEDGNTGLVTGGTVYDSMKALAESNPVKATDEAIFIGPDYGGNVVSLYNKDGEGRVITGVATNPEDATSVANVGYVNTVASNVMENINGRFVQTDKRMNKVGANAAALASLTPASFEGDEKWSLAAAVGKFHGEIAGAIGAFYKPTENVMLNIRGTVGSDENMLGAGVSVSLSKGDIPDVTKRQLANTVNKQANAISVLEQNQQAIIQDREQDKQVIANYQQKVAEQDRQIAKQNEQIKELMKRLEAIEKR